MLCSLHCHGILLLGTGNLPGLLTSCAICLREEQSTPASSLYRLCHFFPMLLISRGRHQGQPGGLQVALGGLSHACTPGAGRHWSNLAALHPSVLWKTTEGKAKVPFGRLLSPREKHLGQHIQGAEHGGAAHHLPTAQTLHPPSAGMPGQPCTSFSRTLDQHQVTVCPHPPILASLLTIHSLNSSEHFNGRIQGTKKEKKNYIFSLTCLCSISWAEDAGHTPSFGSSVNREL